MTRPMVDPDKLGQFLGGFLHDLGGTLNAALVLIGERLGLYRTLADQGPLTAAQLAALTSTDERYVREWLSSQAAGGYVMYDADTERFHMTPEQIFTLADESSPHYLPGAFQVALAAAHDAPKVEAAFRTGAGVGWHEHHTDLFVGTERFFRPNYVANLLTGWLPSLDGVSERLRTGGRVADIGCGLGASTILMAQAFPKSSFTGFDYHSGSIELARSRAQGAGLNGNIQFDVASSKGFPGTGYDLVTMFDCLHDMGDPIGAARHVHASLAAGGTWMIVEPFAHDRLEQNLNPIGRIYYAASTLICTPASKAQEVGLALGAQAGEARLRAVVTEGGFRSFRRASETPFNLVFEAKA